jgi:uncharacterized protein YjiS (DUF1127 family)
MTAAMIRASRPAEEFSACVAAYRASVAELWQTEERMRQALAQMRAEGAPRERLMAAGSILMELQETLRSCFPLPEVSKAGPAAESDRAA